MEVTNHRKCPYCPKTLKSQRYYDDHVRIHTGEKPYKCHRCSYASSQSANLGQHLRKFGKCDPLHCPICNDFSSCSPKGLHIHVEQTHRKKSDEDPTLQDHRDLEEPPVLEAQTYILDPNDIPNPGLYFTEMEDVEPMDSPVKLEETCFQQGVFPKSEKDFDYSVFEEAGFLQGAVVSKRDANFEREESPEIIIESVYSVNDEPENGNLLHCPHCHYSTYDSTALGTHIRAKKDWTFQCQDCEFSSCTSQGIIDHRDETHYNDDAEIENTNEEEEPIAKTGEQELEFFKCHNCCYTATTEWTLIRHQRQMSGEPHKCSLCDYTSCSEYVLKRHERLCNGITPALPLQKPKIEADMDSQGFSGAKINVLKPGNKWKLKQAQRRQRLIRKMQQQQKLVQQKKFRQQQKLLQQKQKLSMQQKLQQQKLNLEQRVQHQNQFSQIQNGKHACPYCGKIFRKNHLTDHLRIHTGERPYKCDKCSFAGAQPSSLTQHKSRKENHDPPLQCTECDFTSCNSVFLRKHVTECHSNTLNIPQLPSAVRNIPDLLMMEVSPKLKANTIPPAIRHQCPYCSYSSLNKSKLTRHISIHFDNKPYLCRYCTYRCRNSTDIKTHERTHTGERPYKCSICPAAFAQAGAFAKHRRSHSENGVEDNEIKKRANITDNKEDPVNGEHFLLAEQFEQVRRTVPDVETYFKCEYCEYQSKSKPDVVRHIRIHTGEKPYQCSMCSFRSARSYDVKRHALTRHFGQAR